MIPSAQQSPRRGGRAANVRGAKRQYRHELAEPTDATPVAGSPPEAGITLEGTCRQPGRVRPATALTSAYRVGVRVNATECDELRKLRKGLNSYVIAVVGVNRLRASFASGPRGRRFKSCHPDSQSRAGRTALSLLVACRAGRAQPGSSLMGAASVPGNGSGEPLRSDGDQA